MLLDHLTSMKLHAVLLLLTLVAASLSSAIPKDDKKNRVVEKDLSDQEHFVHEEHNPDYDHEAFLGREDADAFDQLSPEESKRRLGVIYDKMDKDADGKVTEEELRDWIKHVQNRYIWSDTDRQWGDHEPEEDRLTWDNYKKRTYGFVEEQGQDEDGYDYKEMVLRDERRWNRADRDQDGLLTKEEFADFLHPEDAEHMRDIVIDETLEDIDKDKDGKISVEEYIGDLFTPNDEEDEEDADWIEDEREEFQNNLDTNGDSFLDRDEIMEWIIPEDYDHINEETRHLLNEADINQVYDMWPNHDETEEPEWVKNERDQFSSFRDKNNDGFMDRDEVHEWILPTDYDHSEAEAKHLIYESDEDRDGILTKEEVLEKYDTFVGSQATDFGDALQRHDEF